MDILQRFFHRHTGSLELHQNDHRVLGRLTYQGQSWLSQTSPI